MVYGAKMAGVGLGSLAKATAPTKLAPDPTIRQRVNAFAVPLQSTIIY